MLYITIIDYYIHAKSQMILQFFHIQNVKEIKNVVVNTYSGNRANHTIYNLDRLLRYKDSNF